MGRLMIHLLKLIRLCDGKIGHSENFGYILGYILYRPTTYLVWILVPNRIVVNLVRGHWNHIVDKDVERDDLYTTDRSTVWQQP